MFLWKYILNGAIKKKHFSRGQERCFGCKGGASIPSSLTKGACERILEKEYQHTLETEFEIKLPDSVYDLVEGWLNEETGKKH